VKRTTKFVAGLGALALLGAGAFWLITSPALQSAGTEPIPAGDPDLVNGRVLFTAGGCTSCHATPGQPDKLLLGGGFALPSPFGTFYAPNISPHPRDGIGSWTPQQFARAMRAGVSPDGKHYYPSFPYTSYQRMGAADLRDVFGYMKTLTPVEGRARDHDLPFPFSVRRGLGLWKFAFLDGQPFAADRSKSATWNRGAYLVEGPAHCGECHSPRNLAGGLIAGKKFAGGPNPEGKGWIPNITPHASGTKDWTRGDIGEVLTSGLTPVGDSVGSNMKPVVDNTSKLPASDREAMAEYLLSLPPRENPRPR
jgi:mono/diheme cytochrome c family protein